MGRQSSTSFPAGSWRCAKGCWISSTIPRKSRSRINSDSPKALGWRGASYLAKEGNNNLLAGLIFVGRWSYQWGAAGMKIAPLLGTLIFAVVLVLTPRTAPAQQTLRVAIPLFSNGRICIVGGHR